MRNYLNKKYEKRAKRFLLLVLILIVGFAIWLLNYKDKAPVLFPLDDSKATYTIEKSDNFYSIHYRSTSDKNKSYSCPTKGFYLFFDRSKCKEKIDNDMGVYIGNSNVDLASFNGKNVKISGRFIYSDKQCTLSKCINFSKYNNKFVAFNINNIREDTESFINKQPRDKIIDYVVAEGDTLQSIAGKFSISLDTIKWENNLQTNSIAQGHRLNILPVTGVAHTVEAGDTIESLALKYRTSKQKIIDYPFNKYANPETFSLIPGSIIIIPEGKK